MPTGYTVITIAAYTWRALWFESVHRIRLSTRRYRSPSSRESHANIPKTADYSHEYTKNSSKNTADMC